MRSRSALFLLPLILGACSQAGPPAPPPAPPPPDPVGVYDCSIAVEGQTMFAVMTIEGAPGAYKGTVDSEMGTAPLMDLVVDGKEMTFSVDPGGMLVFFRLTLSEDGFTGGFESDMMGGSITGKRR